jgi:hypothetical protein
MGICEEISAFIPVISPDLSADNQGFIRETQILKTQCTEICKLNNPAEGGGFHTRDL